jgi:hypothetical protein
MTTSHEYTSDGPSAVVWIDTRHAIVARTVDADRVFMAEIERGTDGETQYLAHVVREIGDRERVMIVGQNGVRLALEREYVSISHRPDRLVGAPLGAWSNRTEIVNRLRVPAA